MRKIAIMTGTRADYGLLRPLIAAVEASPEAELQLIVTGTHLSAAHGRTIDEIVRDGFTPAAEVDIWAEELTQALTGEPGSQALTAAVETGEAVAKFSLMLDHLEPDVVVVLGDRLEAFAMATAATVLLIPVAHIHGGELTMGAMDDSLRHAITKLSYLHFATTNEHRARVIQLGESPDRVFNFGAPVLDSIATLDFLGREALEHKFGIKFGARNILMTFHPAAFDVASAQVMIDELLAAMQATDAHLIITGTNNDIGSAEVRKAIDAFVKANGDRVSYVESFGQLGYLSVIQQVDVVTGNSSSTVLEAPIFKVPTVLVGNRQEGRPMGESTINVGADRNQILAALQRALSPEFKDIAAATESPFGQPGFAARALAELISHKIATPPKKKFFSA
ncbi:MAG: hypothetical protein RLZZ590_626 [Actinomycetota bacterium]|jgi:UDP-hydrolysing UDP-N-acetyl-D-glucosamine 2-epimerase